MKKLLCALLALMMLCAFALAEGTLTTNGGVELTLGDLPHRDEAAPITVYYISDITPESLIAAYEALGVELPPVEIPPDFRQGTWHYKAGSRRDRDPKGSFAESKAGSPMANCHGSIHRIEARHPGVLLRLAQGVEYLPDDRRGLAGGGSLIIITFPIWWYTMPAPVKSFLESCPDWQGKRLYVFANSYTDDKRQFMNALIAAVKCAKGADVKPGLYNKDIDRLGSWAEEMGFGKLKHLAPRG